MSDERTPEQVQADELLEAAILNNLKAYGTVPENGVLLDRWLVVGKASVFLDTPDAEGVGLYFRLIQPHIDYDVACAMLIRAQRQLLQKLDSPDE